MSKKSGKKRTASVGFVALGCPKNMVDSEVMLAKIGQAGMILSDDPDRADVVVINTCGFIAPAKEEALDAIRRAVKQKKRGKVRTIVVAGCLSERMGDELLRQIPQIDAVVGLGERDNIAEIINELISAENTEKHSYKPSGGLFIHDDSVRLLLSAPYWAYLRISEGCSRKCSFCTIPVIRGRFRSKPLDMILSEAKQLAEFGAVELDLIAQDSNSWGIDLGIKNGLVRLIGELEKIDQLRWIRLMYLYPAAIDSELIRAVAQSSKVLPYFDMPVQHINNDILRSMRRADTEEHTKAIIEEIRQAIPHAVLRTTVIVGFPGETEQRFEQLLRFIQDVRFDALGAFPFFAESGTLAADLPDQVPEEIRHRRLDKVMLAQQQIAFEKADSLRGREFEILIDSKQQSVPAIGRYYGQAPHIDSVCCIENCSAKPGEFIRARVTGRRNYNLIVKQTSK